MWFAVPWLKGDHLELVAQKLTELGAAGLFVFHARREVARGGAARLERLQRVALEACKQCGRSDVPTIAGVASLEEAVERTGLPAAVSFLLYEGERTALLGRFAALALSDSSTKSVLVASGPEGGLDAVEVGAVQGRVTLVTMGRRILRAETAPIAAAACLLAMAGEM
jgi:16S rRNA (uracil1498-N3)-methyltransferase